VDFFASGFITAGEGAVKGSVAAAGSGKSIVFVMRTSPRGISSEDATGSIVIPEFIRYCPWWNQIRILSVGLKLPPGAIKKNSIINHSPGFVFMGSFILGDKVLFTPLTTKLGQTAIVGSSIVSGQTRHLTLYVTPGVNFTAGEMSFTVR
jgi:hypothetical protein